MRKITEVLRLYHECDRTQREIASAIGVSPTTVGQYLRRAKAAGIGYPLPEGLCEAALEALLFPPIAAPDVVRSEPDWSWVHRELRKKSVTLDLLWQEYKADHPDGYRYSWFCERYRQWAGKLSVSMRQTHTPGEKLFVDYAGQTIPIIDGATGEIRQAQLFVAVLGASNYTYAEATWTQKLPDWIGSHAAPSSSSAVFPRYSSRTTSSQASSTPPITILISIRLIVISLTIMVSPCFRHARANPRTKPRWRAAYWWWNAGFWRG